MLRGWLSREAQDITLIGTKQKRVSYQDFIFEMADSKVYSEGSCAICAKSVEDVDSEASVTLTQKGLNTLRQCSFDRSDVSLYEHLAADPSCVKVHVTCRRDYTNQKRISSVSDDASELKHEVPIKKLRSSCDSFNWKTDCFYCGMPAISDSRHPDRVARSVASTLPLRTHVLEMCDERNDYWADQVRRRIESCIDLVAVEAVYHRSCCRTFNRVRQRTSHANQLPPSLPAGRPEDETKKEAFLQLCDWLESRTDGYLHSVEELHQQMLQSGKNEDEVYSVKNLKRQLMKHYGDHLTFAEVYGRKDVVCLRNMASFILNDKWHKERVEDVASESKRIVEAAAKLIRAEIRVHQYTNEIYPSADDVTTSATGEFVPPLLQLHVQTLIGNKLKETAISHAIVQAARPRSVISPILFGVGVEVDHICGSKYIVDELARLGFSISSYEVKRYKQSVMQSQPRQPSEGECFPSRFTQWVADNVDHNIATLDGLGTFHGMGIIAVKVRTGNVTPDVAHHSIKRVARMKAKESVKALGLTIHHFKPPQQKALSMVNLKEIRQLQRPHTLPLDVNLDLLWHSGWIFRIPYQDRPNWSGFMQHVCVGDHPPLSEVQLLPILDLNPSDNNCIYSTLIFIEQQAKQLNIVTPCITFDQPLWLKAVEIIKASSMNVFCRLGGFHTLMSFLGSIGSLMAGAGLTDILEISYGPNTVCHIMSGKAVSRALCGFFLVDAALAVLLIRLLLPSSELTDMPGLSEQDVQDIEKLYESLLDDVSSNAADTVSGTPALQNLEQLVQMLKCQLSERSRTAKLWVQYMYEIETVKLFLRAERTSNWSLHVTAMTRMLNLFAATGHLKYAKCARLYVQMMIELPETYPWLYTQFTDYGFHSVRRSDRYWAGLSTDLVIEQVLMRSLKSRGGLTHGRGLSENVRLCWIYTMHQCAAVHLAMTQLTGLQHSSSEQHVEMGKSRTHRDSADLMKILHWLEGHNPFTRCDSALTSLSTGLTARNDDGINCDSAEEVGQAIQNQMDGCAFSDVTVKKRSTIKTMIQLQKGIIIGEKTVFINCRNLFNRLIILAERSEDMQPFFQYELTSTPSSLFKDGLMRKPDKAALGKLLSKDASVTQDCKDHMHVLDGGSLLHRVRWPKVGTYAEIAGLYLKYIAKYYAKDTIIVFDGYSGVPSTKDQEHQRRFTTTTATVLITSDAPVHRNQTAFLANSANKSGFINFLTTHLQMNGYAVRQSAGDADTLIVATALELAAKMQRVIVVASDTDILVLLTYHWKANMAEILMKRESTKSNSSTLVSIPLVQKTIGSVAVDRLLAIHAISGCDMTSALFGHGKNTAFKKLSADGLQQHFSVIKNCEASHEQVGTSGCQLLVALYGGKVGSDSLDRLRYSTYMKLAATSKTHIMPEQLPPTERAAYFHCLRSHLQVMEWQQLMIHTDPCDWGWEMVSEKLVPIATDKDPAPETLLNVIRCSCKVESRNCCGTGLCSCKKNGLTCVAACANCHGEECNNVDSTKEMQDVAVSDDEELHYVEDDDIMWQYEEVVTGLEVADVFAEDDDVTWQYEEELF